MANFEAQIVKAREEAISRREILDKINRWLAICDEENWLEVYNQVSIICKFHREHYTTNNCLHIAYRMGTDMEEEELM